MMVCLSLTEVFLIKQPEEPEWNLVAVTDIYAVAYNIAVFNAFYLLEPLVLSTHFERPFPVYDQIALGRHREFMTNT